MEESGDAPPADAAVEGDKKLEEAQAPPAGGEADAQAVPEAAVPTEELKKADTEATP